MHIVAVGRPRCLVVAFGLTAALWGVAALLARAAAGQPAGPDGPDRALVRLCLAVLVVAALWAWLQGMAGVAEAWRGGGSPARGAVRRLVLVACGAALAGSLAAPAQATPDRPRPDLLSGLPLPDRAQGAARPLDRRVVVRPGDSLWAFAEHDLRAPASDRLVSDRWHAIYRRNRGVIGPDPDLIHPGQVLRISKEHR
jgi:LysM domain